MARVAGPIEGHARVTSPLFSEESFSRKKVDLFKRNNPCQKHVVFSMLIAVRGFTTIYSQTSLNVSISALPHPYMPPSTAPQPPSNTNFRAGSPKLRRLGFALCWVCRVQHAGPCKSCLSARARRPGPRSQHHPNQRSTCRLRRYPCFWARHSKLHAPEISTKPVTTTRIPNSKKL